MDTNFVKAFMQVLHGDVELREYHNDGPTDPLMFDEDDWWRIFDMTEEVAGLDYGLVVSVSSTGA